MWMNSAAPEELGDNLRYVEGGPTRPDKAAEKLEVHPDFNISLVASEPLIRKAMNIDWDEKGRLWVCVSPRNIPTGAAMPKEGVVSHRCLEGHRLREGRQIRPRSSNT